MSFKTGKKRRIHWKRSL